MGKPQHLSRTKHVLAALKGGMLSAVNVEDLWEVL